MVQLLSTWVFLVPLPAAMGSGSNGAKGGNTGEPNLEQTSALVSLLCFPETFVDIHGTLLFSLTAIYLNKFYTVNDHGSLLTGCPAEQRHSFVARPIDKPTYRVE